MAALTRLPVIYLLLSRLVRTYPSEAFIQNSTSHRQARSGGYPKFPLQEYQPPTCGTRQVAHEPSRAGQPAAKIVGGSIAPYGAYPWQLSVAVGPYSNDIGLIKVRALSEGGISFNSHVRPICLPELQAKGATGSWCSVTGWGAQRPEDVDSSLSQVLQVAAVPLLDLDTCRRADVYGGRRQSILDSMLCAGSLEGGVDACGGDSGGPLACEINGRFVLTGIVSWGDGCAQKNRPGVYTRVSHYVDWIQVAKKILGA
ncbi:serine protease 30 [Cryptotermes secundus]|uniref:serine protease 30 n=1 Tax=Cryptotermes secundus TaxID=105785 RepID=UPI000CD7AD27|nr:serine protease 30 [Cryptotermes secundus]